VSLTDNVPKKLKQNINTVRFSRWNTSWCRH